MKKTISRKYAALLSVILALVMVTAVSAQPTPKKGTLPMPAKEPTAVGGVLVSPLVFRIPARAGTDGEVIVQTSNPMSVQAGATITLYSATFEDWSYRANTGVTHSRDALKWFKETTKDYIYAPGENRNIPLKYKIPTGVSGTFWCLMRFSPRTIRASDAIRLEYDIPIVFLVGRQTRPEIKVKSPAIENFTKGSPTFRLSVPVENTGTGFTTFGVECQLRNLTTGALVTTVSDGDRNLYPETKRSLEFTIGQIPDGRYQVTTNLELGARRLPPVKADFVISKGIATPATAATILALPPVAIEPRGFQTILPRGGRRTQIVRITNTSQRALTLDLKPTGVEQVPTGGIGPAANVELPAGLTVTIEPQSVSLEPGRVAAVRVTTELDTERAQGDLWFLLTVAEAGRADSLSETMIADVLVRGTEAPALTIRGEKIRRTGNIPTAVEYEVKNSGNLALRPLATASFLEGGLKSLASLEVKIAGDGGILPGATLIHRVLLPANIKPGTYVVEVNYQYGPAEKDTVKTRVPLTVAADKPGKPVKTVKK